MSVGMYEMMCLSSRRRAGRVVTGDVCTTTAIYRSGCSCRSRTLRGRGEIFPSCLRCQGKVEWELVQALPVLDMHAPTRWERE